MKPPEKLSGCDRGYFFCSCFGLPVGAEAGGVAVGATGVGVNEGVGDCVARPGPKLGAIGVGAAGCVLNVGRVGGGAGL